LPASQHRFEARDSLRGGALWTEGRVTIATFVERGEDAVKMGSTGPLASTPVAKPKVHAERVVTLVNQSL
jgi:hypothetical protein